MDDKTVPAEKKTAKLGAGSIILVILACVMALCAISSLLYFVVFRTPLSSGIVGEWKLAVEGKEAFGNVAESLDKYVTSSGAGIEFPDVTEYFTFNEDGTYSITVDSGSMIYSLNTAVSSIIDHYSKHTDEFIEKSGYDREYFEENGINDLNFKDFLETLFQSTRENIAKTINEYEKDENGNVLAAIGRYTVEGSTVKLTLGSDEANETDFGYFKASVRFSVMTVKETDLTVLFKGDEVALVKVDNTDRK